MSSLQKAAQAAIKTHGTIRKAAKALGLDHANLYRISRGTRKAVTAATAAKLGLAPMQSWRRL
jgi:plasmid maintenance system antidote protein VapI